MERGAARAWLTQLARRAADWPPILRDFAAASLGLWSICLGVMLMGVLPLPAEVVLALPGVLIAWWVMGASSAAFALLVATLAVSLIAGDRPTGLPGATGTEVLAFFAMATALVSGCLAAWNWARARERRAARLLDACADDAVQRIAAADTRLRSAEAAASGARAKLGAAEAELACARQAAAEIARRGPGWSRDGGLDEARRGEGGV